MNEEEDSTRLSDELVQMIDERFMANERSAVREILLEPVPGMREADRVRFDILHLANGDIARVRALMNVAKRDPRDVMAAEYYRENGRSIPHEWARRHPVNRQGNQ